MPKSSAALKIAEPKSDVVMRPLTSLRLASEAPAALGLQVRKSRDDDPAADAVLRASIRTHGVILPLVVRKHDGVYYVTAGNRRLRLVREMAGEIGGDGFMLPTIDSDRFDGDPREIAMATNVALPPHPIDRYEIIALMVQEGLSPEDAKFRFGLSDKTFRQTMRLGMLGDAVRNAYRSGEIDGATAQAFTLEPDRDRQDKLFARIKKTAYQNKVRAHDVRASIIGNGQQDVGRMVEFVGLKACREAKILKQEDLFGTSHTVTSVPALKKMADQRVAEICKGLLHEGWAWAIPEPSQHWGYGTIEAKKAPDYTGDEAARINAVNGFDGHDPEIEMIHTRAISRGFTAEQRAKSGCFVSIGHDGSPTISYGRVKPEERKKVEAANRKSAKKGVESTPAKSSDLSGPLANRLSLAMQRAAAKALASDHRLAGVALVAAFASGDTLAVKVEGMPPPEKAPSFRSVLETNLLMRPAEILAVLAQVAAQALRIECSRADAMPMKDDSHAALLNVLPTKVFMPALRKEFDAKNYFGSVSMATVASAVEEALGVEHVAKVRKMKKAAAAKFAAANVPPTGWLPVELRTAHYDGPDRTKQGKGRRGK